MLNALNQMPEDINESMDLSMALGISKQMHRIYFSIEFQEIIGMAYICVKEQREKHPDNKDETLRFVNAKWKLNRYCKNSIHDQLLDKHFVREEIDIYEVLDKRPSYEEILNEKIMKIDMQHNLSSDALFTVDGILEGSFLRKITKEEYSYADRFSKKLTIIENLKKEGWKRARAKKAVEEISHWWEDYFNVESKKNTMRKEGEIVTYYRNGKPFKKIKKNGKMVCLKKEDNSVN